MDDSAKYGSKGSFTNMNFKKLSVRIVGKPTVYFPLSKQVSVKLQQLLRNRLSYILKMPTFTLAQSDLADQPISHSSFPSKVPKRARDNQHGISTYKPSSSSLRSYIKTFTISSPYNILQFCISKFLLKFDSLCQRKLFAVVDCAVKEENTSFRNL